MALGGCRSCLCRHVRLIFPLHSAVLVVAVCASSRALIGFFGGLLVVLVRS